MNTLAGGTETSDWRHSILCGRTPRPPAFRRHLVERHPMNNQALLRYHYETQVAVNALPAEVFDFLDDHRRLSAHMTKPSWKMAGSSMNIAMDEKEGRALGSRITLTGRILGLSLKVEEVVTRYDPPRSKTWETVGSPRLLVIGPYAMGFVLTPRQGALLLCVAIDYSPPPKGAAHLLGRLFGKSYARWCTNRMVQDAMRHFSAIRGQRR